MNKPNPEFGPLLRKFRRAYRKTQNELASDLGMDPTNLSRLENGLRLPPKDQNFYDRLDELPLLPNDIALLRSAGDVPMTFRFQRVPRSHSVSVGEVKVGLVVDQAVLNDQELEELGLEVQNSLTGVLQLIRDRKKRLGLNNS